MCGLLQLDGDLFNLSRECEWHLIGEVHRRADIHPDVQTFTQRNLERDRPLEMLLGDVRAVDGQDYGRGPAAFPTLALILEVDGELYLASGERFLAADRGAIEFQIVVNERRPSIAHVKTVSANQPAMRDDHAFRAAIRNDNISRQRPRFVENPRCGFIHQSDLPGVVRIRLAITRQTGTAHELGVEAFDGAPIKRQDLVFARLRPPEILQFAELLGIGGRQIVRLGEIFVDVVEFPRLLVRIKRFGSQGENDIADAIQPS